MGFFSTFLVYPLSLNMLCPTPLQSLVSHISQNNLWQPPKHTFFKHVNNSVKSATVTMTIPVCLCRSEPKYFYWCFDTLILLLSIGIICLLHKGTNFKLITADAQVYICNTRMIFSVIQSQQVVNMSRSYKVIFPILGPDLSNAVQTLCVAFMDTEVKVSFCRRGEGGMPNHLTVQFPVWLHCTWWGGKN